MFHLLYIQVSAMVCWFVHITFSFKPRKTAFSTAVLLCCVFLHLTICRKGRISHVTNWTAMFIRLFKGFLCERARPTRSVVRARATVCAAAAPAAAAAGVGGGMWLPSPSLLSCTITTTCEDERSSLRGEREREGRNGRRSRKGECLNFPAKSREVSGASVALICPGNRRRRFHSIQFRGVNPNPSVR